MPPTRSSSKRLTSPTNSQDELTSTIFEALQVLPQANKANFLLDTALALIEAGQYGAEVENYLEVYLRTPGLPKVDVARAYLARGSARRAAGEKLLLKAQRDFQSAASLDPTNRTLLSQVQRDNKLIHFANEPASHRAPPEVWERIAGHIPRYFLRTWLSVSAFHRRIAVQHIFQTLDLYFGEDPDNLNRGLDVFDRVKSDRNFASHIKTLRLHWAYEEGDMLDLMARIFRTVLPEFKALKDFEWIGYPEMRADMVQAVLSSHPKLQNLGLVGWHFDAVGVSAFTNLRKFTLRAEDDDGFADMGEVRTVLDKNERTLRHLCLGAYLARNHSWDSAFQSVTIKDLTHLDLVDTKISHIVLARIAHAHNLQSLTLHGTFEEPSSASVVFGSDHIIGGTHTFLPHLEAFRFVLVGHDDELGLFQSVTQFLRRRRKLRRLDLGGCPWDLVKSVLGDLVGLRVLRARIANCDEGAVRALVAALPAEMVAIHLGTTVSEKPMHEYASLFKRFHSLSFLHFHLASQRRPKPNLLSEKDFQVQTETWLSSARSIALAVPSVDFLGWHGEHYVVVRSSSTTTTSSASTTETNFAQGGADASVSNLTLVGGGAYASAGSGAGAVTAGGGLVEIKELPSRRRLDCGKGVDLGCEDAGWLERKDVPMDYETPGLEAMS